MNPQDDEDHYFPWQQRFFFASFMIILPLLQQSLRTRTNSGMVQVYDPIRKQWVALTPEEHVRQLLLAYLIGHMGFPPALIAVERGLSFGHTTLRFDVVVYDRDMHQPWLLAECKAPDIALTDTTLHQLLQYHSKLPACRYWLITNGRQAFCADASDRQQIVWMTDLPAY